VNFEPLSIYYHKQSTAPDLAYRTYGDFVLDFAGYNEPVIGSGTLNVVNLTMASSGNFNIGLAGQAGEAVTINGNIAVATGGTLAFAPAAKGDYNMVGTSQTISGPGAFTLGANASFNIASGTTVTLDNTIAGVDGQVGIFGTLITDNIKGLYGTGAAIESTNIIWSIGAGSTVVYNRAGEQTISELAYANLTIAGNRNNQTVTLPIGTGLKVSEVFTPSATNVVYSDNSTIEFNGVADQTIPVLTGGYHNLKVSGGTKFLEANITMLDELNMAGGIVKTASNRLILETGASIAGESESSYIQGFVEALPRSVAKDATQAFGNIGVTLTPANAGGLSDIGILRHTGDAAAVPPSPDSPIMKPSIKRVFTINGPASGVNVTMTMGYLALELNGNVPAELHMYKQHPNDLWEEQTAETYTYGSNAVTYPGVTGFSKWTLGSPNVVLPVELTAFTAKRRHNQADLAWTTALEDNNQGFEVEVSTDAQYYEKVGFVASKNPNSRISTNYTFTDDKTLVAGIRYYRLKQVDLDGKVTYFGPKVLSFEGAVTAAKVYPNPFNDVFTVKYAAQASHAVTLTVMDALGKKVYEQVVPVTSGMHYLQVQVGNHHPKGVYLLNISGANSVQHFKLLKK
jgi:hypothetical protein